MTRPAEPLVRLAGLYGIETVYTDAYDRRREVPRESLRALLVAMGVEPFTDRQIGERLRAVERRRAGRLVEPVVVATAEAPIALSLHLPDALPADAALTWTLQTEDGRALEGRATVDQLRPDPDAPGRHLLRLRRRLGEGEHRLELLLAGERAEARLIVAPRRCFLPDDLDRDRMYGLSAQLYGLRSGRDFGIGDFADLAELCRAGARAGASLIGVNPLHALFPAEPRHFSPYSPSNRSFLNPIYIAPDRVPGFRDDQRAAHAAAIEAARAGDLVDYPAVARIKRDILEPLFEGFRADHLRTGQESDLGRAFLAFARESGRPLFLQACFDALHETMLERHGIWSWREWPAAFRDAAGPEVGAFAAGHGERIVFFQWLQWLADRQLGEAQHAARAGGMAVGLYRDLAVGVHPDGAAAWSFPDVAVPGVSIGAPPDQFNRKGQSWGLAPFSPVGLRHHGYQPLLDDLQRNMRHAGAVRIDHVMGLSRLFWVPDGASPAEGAYVRYPLQDLTRLIALASHRERCLVIGEDLGTVAPGFRETMHEAGVLSYRVLWFERDSEGAPQPPASYPERALATVSTHDLPTLQGFVQGRDIAWRSRLEAGEGDGAPDPAALEARRQEVAVLLRALRGAGLLEDDVDPEAADFPARLERAVHTWLAAAPSQIMMVQLDDLLGEVEQANLPGTTDEHPNWRRRLPLTVDEIAADPALARLAATMREAGRAGTR